MVLAMAGQVRRALFRLRWQAGARSAPRMEFRRIWLFHDCIGVVSGNRPRADERVSFVELEHQQVVLQLSEVQECQWVPR